MLAQKREVVLHFDSSQRSRFRFLFCCIIKLYAKREDRAETPFGEIRIPSSDTVEERTILQRILNPPSSAPILISHTTPLCSHTTNQSATSLRSSSQCIPTTATHQNFPTPAPPAQIPAHWDKNIVTKQPVTTAAALAAS